MEQANSAGSCDEFDDPIQIATAERIVAKRKYIDWSRANQFPPNLDIRPERTDQEGPFEYLVEWKDHQEFTWEKVESLLNIKEMLREFDMEKDAKERSKRQVSQKFENMRKRSRKAWNKGSFEKGNKIDRVLGLRKNKHDNQLMCRVSWHTVTY